jgi:hypothetical protein
MTAPVDRRIQHTRDGGNRRLNNAGPTRPPPRHRQHSTRARGRRPYALRAMTQWAMRGPARHLKLLSDDPVEGSVADRERRLPDLPWPHLLHARQTCLQFSREPGTFHSCRMRSMPRSVYARLCRSRSMGPGLCSCQKGEGPPTVIVGGSSRFGLPGVQAQSRPGTGHRRRSVYHLATCIGMHHRFCKTESVRDCALHAILSHPAPVIRESSTAPLGHDVGVAVNQCRPARLRSPCRVVAVLRAK